jgi:lipoyl(octanoyl) transferase
LVSLPVTDLGRAAYAAAAGVQRRVHAEVLAARDAGSPVTGRLILVEHDPPVITVSRRPDATRHLIASAEALAHEGVEVCETDRGGDITYHGTGQLVAYPIIDLNAMGLNLHEYMRLLEEVVIDTLAPFGVRGVREAGATGVWVPTRHGMPAHQGARKICAMGVRVRRWVTMHGLALNVTTNLAHFDLIVPCGLARPVTSLERELGQACPAMAAVKRSLVESFESRLAGLSPV